MIRLFLHRFLATYLFKLLYVLIAYILLASTVLLCLIGAVYCVSALHLSHAKALYTLDKSRVNIDDYENFKMFGIRSIRQYTTYEYPTYMDQGNNGYQIMYQNVHNIKFASSNKAHSKNKNIKPNRKNKFTNPKQDTSNKANKKTNSYIQSDARKSKIKNAQTPIKDKSNIKKNNIKKQNPAPDNTTKNTIKQPEVELNNHTDGNRAIAFGISHILCIGYCYPAKNIGLNMSFTTSNILPKTFNVFLLINRTELLLSLSDQQQSAVIMDSKYGKDAQRSVYAKYYDIFSAHVHTGLQMVFFPAQSSHIKIGMHTGFGLQYDHIYPKRNIKDEFINIDHTYNDVITILGNKLQKKTKGEKGDAMDSKKIQILKIQGPSGSDTGFVYITKIGREGNIKLSKQSIISGLLNNIEEYSKRRYHVNTAVYNNKMSHYYLVHNFIVDLGFDFQVYENTKMNINIGWRIISPLISLSIQDKHDLLLYIPEDIYKKKYIKDIKINNIPFAQQGNADTINKPDIKKITLRQKKEDIQLGRSEINIQRDQENIIDFTIAKGRDMIFNNQKNDNVVVKTNYNKDMIDKIISENDIALDAVYSNIPVKHVLFSAIAISFAV